MCLGGSRDASCRRDASCVCLRQTKINKDVIPFIATDLSLEEHSAKGESETVCEKKL